MAGAPDPPPPELPPAPPPGLVVWVPPLPDDPSPAGGTPPSSSPEPHARTRAHTAPEQPRSSRSRSAPVRGFAARRPASPAHTTTSSWSTLRPPRLDIRSSCTVCLVIASAHDVERIAAGDGSSGGADPHSTGDRRGCQMRAAAVSRRRSGAPFCAPRITGSCDPLLGSAAMGREHLGVRDHDVLHLGRLAIAAADVQPLQNVRQ